MSLGLRSGRSPYPALLLNSKDVQPRKTSEEQDIQQALDTCNTNSQLIASQAEHLHRMRSRCATSALLTQQEIRNVEEKLVKLFTMQLLSKINLPLEISIPPELQCYPSLRQWLQVVGLSKDVIEGLCSDLNNLEELLEKNDCQLHSALSKHASDPWEVAKLIRAVGNLKKYAEHQLEGNEDEYAGQLYWDSWETSDSATSTISHTSQRAQRSSLSSSDGDSGSSGVVNGVSFFQNGSQSSSGISMNLRGSDDSNPSSPSFNLSQVPPLSPSIITSQFQNNLTLPYSSTFQDNRYTPPPTPPISSKGNAGRSPGDRRFPPTPPPSKKNMLLNPTKLSQSQTNSSSLGRSTSHESQLTYRLKKELNNLPNLEHLTSRRVRLQSDSGSELVMSSDANRGESGSSVFYTDLRDQNLSNSDLVDTKNKVNYNCSSLVGKLTSPTTRSFRFQNGGRFGHKYNMKNSKISRRIDVALSGSMGHNVHHRFTIALKPDKCGYCHQKFPLLQGLKCKECNFKCHRECEPKIAPSCGLPRELLEVFTEKLRRDMEMQSGNLASPIATYARLNDSLQKGGISTSQPAINIFPTLSHDSSSNTSSCNSSTPSSPALVIPQSPAHNAFVYSDLTIQSLQHSHIPVDMRPWVTYEARPAPKSPHKATDPQSRLVESHQSQDSDRTVSTTSGSGSTGTDDSERTMGERLDSQDSTVSESDLNDPSRCTRQNSVSSVSQSLREWDIPYDELDRGEMIGKGRFGTVYSGNWHGQVAIRELHLDYANDDKTLEAFKVEVSTFRKTRHENLVLFMGACMKPPRLAIVTSLCKGMTLFGHIHILKDKFTMSRTIPIVQQIAQGMGYLHARGIVHKDLKSKNIFLENGKVIITDFGLFNVARLCSDTRRGEWLTIPPGWLCYLSPEVMRALKLHMMQKDGLPFTTYSDIYAFGTVWYELLCGEWPHRGLPPEAVIWQVGRGIKPSLAHLQASRDVKEILMVCWSFHAEERRDFSSLLTLLTKLPKKRLARSPSHPVQLSRSAESVF